MRRRIEITVYRRATVAFQVQSGDKGWAKPESGGSDQVPAVSAPSEEPENCEAQLNIVDLARSAGLTLLIEALVRNDGDSTRAAGDLGLSRTDFISRLCSFAFGAKQ